MLVRRADGVARGEPRYRVDGWYEEGERVVDGLRVARDVRRPRSRGGSRRSPAERALLRVTGGTTVKLPSPRRRIRRVLGAVLVEAREARDALGLDLAPRELTRVRVVPPRPTLGALSLSATARLSGATRFFGRDDSGIRASSNAGARGI